MSHAYPFTPRARREPIIPLYTVGLLPNGTIANVAFHPLGRGRPEMLPLPGFSHRIAINQQATNSWHRDDCPITAAAAIYYAQKHIDPSGTFLAAVPATLIQDRIDQHKNENQTHPPV